ncbi:MAG: TonB-dependent receptor, partial [bacterium]|nr:TonB-dependent receptor [bacterium]
GLGSQIATDTSLKTIKNFIHGKLTPPRGSGPLQWEADLFFDYLKSRFSDPQGEIGLGVQNNNDTTVRVGPEFHANMPWGKNQILSGFLAYRIENFWPTNYAANPASGPMSQRQMIGIGGEDELGFFDEKLVLDPSLRLQVYLNHLSGDDPSITPAVPNNDTTNTQLSGKLGVKWAAFSFLYFKGNAYRGFRQPTFGELFGDRGNIVGNPGLLPEKSLNWDAGARALWNDLGFVDQFSLEAGYFRQNVDELIQFVQTSQFTIRAQNAASALIWGAEAALSMRMWEHLKIGGNYMYQIAKDDSNNSPTRGKFLPGRPKQQIYADAEWQYLYFTPFTQLQLLTSNFLDSQNLLKVNHRTLLAAGFYTQPLNWLKFTFTTKNLLNEHVVDIAGFPLPERSYWAELELRL